MATAEQLPPALDDAQLVERARAGDERAFATLYHRHVRYVAGVLFRILRHEGDLNDVLQQAFALAFVQLGQLREPAGFRSWVTRIGVRRAQDCLIARKRQERLGEAQATLHPATSSARDEAAEQLYEVLGRLSPKLRVPWILHYLEGETIEETARLCEISLSTAKRRVVEAHELVVRWLKPP